MNRTILHCDMNNFYASVECFLDPKLKPFPVAVCGDVEERHGIVLAKNYKAKGYGVSTGEAIWQAKQKCPGLVVVPPHYEEYMKFSKAAREIYEEIMSFTRNNGNVGSPYLHRVLPLSQKKPSPFLCEAMIGKIPFVRLRFAPSI